MYDEHDRRGPERDERTGDDTTDWDDEETGRNLGGRLAYLFLLLRRGDAHLRRGDHPRAGAFQGQGRVLHLLSLQSPIAQKELAYLLGIRSQSLGELLGKLEEAGLVRREPSPEDRRTSMVDLTDAGRTAAEQREETPSADPFTVLSDEEQDQLAGLLDRVIEAMESRLPGGADAHMRKFKQMAFGFEGRGGPGFGRGFGPGFDGPGHREHRGGRGRGRERGGERGRERGRERERGDERGRERGRGRSPRGERWDW
ncbi:MarR family transcriptional regulator [Glycomyces sp. NPDC047369]